MFRYAIKIEYDGTNFHGWQKQNSLATVQGTINEALDKLDNSKSGVTGAGRTDAGVHALGQVAHLDTTKNWQISELQNALNYHLKPHPISVIRIAQTSIDFHARFSAVNRHYLFKILIRRPPLTLNKNRFWHVKRLLKIVQMREAAAHLVGQHDFTTFRSSSCGAKSPIKTMEKILIKKSKDKITLQFTSRSFLQQQVRSMVGCLKYLGESKWDLKDFIKSFKSKNRIKCAPPAPACGLYLTNIEY